MNRVRTYITSPLVSLSRFDHPKSECHQDPKHEIASVYSINFIECGNYELQVGRREWQMSPGQVFITGPGMVFRFRHQEEFPDDVCFSVIYEQHFLENDPHQVLSKQLFPVVPLNNRLAYLHTRLSCLSASNGDVLAAEVLSGELLAAAVPGPAFIRNKLYSGNQFAWYMERVEAARSLIENSYSDPHSLSSLARLTGMSPFHFARVFRELTGTPPHRYLLGVRLKRASEMLGDGVSVTEACYDSGFANLSHFIRLFSRAYGVSPSRFVPKAKRSRSRTTKKFLRLR